MRVRLVQDDIDRHGEGCDCGLCASNGKSVGIGIYDATDDDGSDPYERVYGCSEQTAMENARALCVEKGWKIVESENAK